MTPRSETPKDEGPWAWQCRGAAIEAGNLGINAFAIYCALTHFQSAASTEHKRRFSASYEQIAELVGCSRGTVAVALVALEKAKLIRLFSGSNGARRATRNSFFLTSISSPPDGRGSPPDGRHVSTPHGRDVSPPRGRFNKKENNYAAPPQAAAGVVEKEEEEGLARSRLGRSGGPLKNESYHLRDLTPEEIEQARRIHEMTKNL